MTDVTRLDLGEGLFEHAPRPELGDKEWRWTDPQTKVFMVWAYDNFPWMRDVIRAAQAVAEFDRLPPWNRERLEREGVEALMAEAEARQDAIDVLAALLTDDGTRIPLEQVKAEMTSEKPPTTRSAE